MAQICLCKQTCHLQQLACSMRAAPSFHVDGTEWEGGGVE